jgi:hypothetical protein
MQKPPHRAIAFATDLLVRGSIRVTVLVRAIELGLFLELNDPAEGGFRGLMIKCTQCAPVEGYYPSLGDPV